MSEYEHILAPDDRAERALPERVGYLYDLAYAKLAAARSGIDHRLYTNESRFTSYDSTGFGVRISIAHHNVNPDLGVPLIEMSLKGRLADAKAYAQSEKNLQQIEYQRDYSFYGDSKNRSIRQAWQPVPILRDRSGTPIFVDPAVLGQRFNHEQAKGAEEAAGLNIVTGYELEKLIKIMEGAMPALNEKKQRLIGKKVGEAALRGVMRLLGLFGANA